MDDAPGASDPHIDQSVAVLQRLIRMWHLRDGRFDLPIVDRSPLVGAAIHVQVEHCVELAESVVELLRQNVYLSTAPLIRLTLECAVTAAWWATAPSTVLASVHESARQQLSRVVEGRKSRPGPFAEVSELTETIEGTARFAAAAARDFRQRCEAIHGGSWLYAHYKHLSEMSHAGPNLLSEYTTKVDASESNPIGLEFHQRPHFRDLDFALAVQGVALLLAMSTWSAISQNSENESELAHMADQLGVGGFIRGVTERIIKP